MVTKLDWDDPRIAEAMVAWTGFGQTVTPVWDDQRVRSLFKDDARWLLPILEELASDFYATRAHTLGVSDTVSLLRRAESDFLLKHPNVQAEVIKALGWCYTWDHR